ncbi:MAG: ParA family protein [Burkholderiales bacterium]|nr:ParA family protein [Burkholderiales bacterium]
MPCIAIFNQKGGVGKTTTAWNLAAAVSRSGVPVTQIDLDPQAHLSDLCGIGKILSESSIYGFYHDHRTLSSLLVATGPHRQLIPAHLELAKVDTQYGKGPDILNRLKHALMREHLAGASRAVIIDCCPMLGVLSLSGVFAADHVLVPISADYLAVKGALQVEKSLNALSRVFKQRIGRRYVLTRFDGRRRMSWDIEKTLRAHFGDELCETRISENVAVAESPEFRRDVIDYAPSSRGAQDYLALHHELVDAGYLPVPAAEEPAKVYPEAHVILRDIAVRAAATRS